MEERIIYKAECGIIHKTKCGTYIKRALEDESVPYPSERVRHHFTRNGVSLQNLLRFLYITKIDYRNLMAINNKDTRMIFENEIIKLIFKTSDGDYIYIKCKDTRYCDVWLMPNSEFNKIVEENLFLCKTAIIARTDKLNNKIRRFCRRIKTEVYRKENCTEEVIQTIKNTKNVIKLKKIKELMKRVHNEEGRDQ